jgi:hypothetical protein
MDCPFRFLKRPSNALSVSFYILIVHFYTLPFAVTIPAVNQADFLPNRT